MTVHEVWEHMQKTFGLVRVSGTDAKKFLQGQLTCNLEEVIPSQSRLGAHCNPQGRVLFLFRIFCFQNDYYLLMPHEIVSLALQYLGQYAIFYKLTLSDASPIEQTALHALASQEWAYFNISLGRPQIYCATSGKFLPHDLNLHHQGGISWDKGCYTGQEIIARMQYRGKLKNQLHLVRVQTPTQPVPGTEISGSHNSLIVDYCLETAGIYQLLILTQENEINSMSFALDPQQNETWEWLSYSTF